MPLFKAVLEVMVDAGREDDVRPLLSGEKLSQFMVATVSRVENRRMLPHRWENKPPVGDFSGLYCKEYFNDEV